MAKWTIPMPKDKPKAGHAHFKVAYKNEAGQRVEFLGQLPADSAYKVVDYALELLKQSKD